MKYYSTNGKAPLASLHKAVVKGLAEDKGLYMPERIKKLPQAFFDHIESLSPQEIAFRVAEAFFGEDVEAGALRDIVNETLSFDLPVVPVDENIYALELFHGPTLAFKDVGARFMARLLRYFLRREDSRAVNVLVATSGDTGSAVANGFLGVDGIRVYVLYPKGKVSHIQECQFTTLGRNITALEVDGVFDDCQALVKQAFMDEELNHHMRLTSANSINVARFLPQAFYYFIAYAALKRQGKAENLVVAVPSGNFGNITAGIFGREAGLPIRRFIAANNANDVFLQYLRTGEYRPKPSVQTIANAMDVGDPSNFARIQALFHGSHERVSALVSGAAYSDERIAQARPHGIHARPSRCLRLPGLEGRIEGRRDGPVPGDRPPRQVQGESGSHTGRGHRGAREACRLHEGREAERAHGQRLRHAQAIPDGAPLRRASTRQAKRRMGVAHPSLWLPGGHSLPLT